MQRALVGLSTFQIALATVLGVFAFLAAFFPVSDRFGGWSIGSLSAIALALLVFVGALFFASRFVSKTVEPKGPETTPTPAPPVTTIQSPVNVRVPLEVRLARETPTRGPGAEPGNTTKKFESAKEPTKASLGAAYRKGKEAAAAEGSEPQKSPRRVIETIHDDEVEVNAGREGCWDYELPLEIGDTLEGDIREVDGYDFDWMICSSKEFSVFLNGGDPEIIEGETDVVAATIDWKVTEQGRWYLVLVAYGKVYSRNVYVKLRRVRLSQSTIHP